MPKRFIERFLKIDSLIQKKATGNAMQLGEKLEVSDRTAKEFISVMKEFGAPIYFDRIRNSYCYKEQGNFNISFITVK